MASLQSNIPPNHADYFPIRHHAFEGSSQRLRVRFLKCSDPVCGREDEITDNGNIALPTDVVKRKFRQKGWDVGKNREHDICPVCVENQRLARRKPKEEPVLKPPGDNGPPPQMMVGSGPIEPRKMDTDDRRIIFAAIDERWASKEAGYNAPWTDHAVATYLEMPLAWVVEVRSQFFGEVRDNQEIRDLLERANKAIAEAEKQVAAALQLQKDTSSMITRVNAMNATLAELRKSVEGLAAIASRIEGKIK